MGLDIQSLIGGTIADAFAKIVGVFKADPNKVLDAQTELSKIQFELQGKLLDQVSTEIQSAAEVIKAEAQSQSWLPRNVRPLLLLLWGSAITVNIVVTIIARLFSRYAYLQPVTLPDWVYKLTAIGFTGYVSWRSIEKLKDADN